MWNLPNNCEVAIWYWTECQWRIYIPITTYGAPFSIIEYLNWTLHGISVVVYFHCPWNEYKQKHFDPNRVSSCVPQTFANGSWCLNQHLCIRQSIRMQGTSFKPDCVCLVGRQLVFTIFQSSVRVRRVWERHLSPKVTVYLIIKTTRLCCALRYHDYIISLIWVLYNILLCLWAPTTLSGPHALGT